MNNFSIKVLGNKGACFCEGEVRIGEFIESFKMALGSWSLEEYKQQWHEGLERLKNHDQSCLIANIQEFENSLVDWWILYKEGNTVYVQNELMAGDCLQAFLTRGEFNRETCYDFIEPRQTVTKDGEKISEWSFEL